MAPPNRNLIKQFKINMTPELYKEYKEKLKELDLPQSSTTRKLIEDFIKNN